MSRRECLLLTVVVLAYAAIRKHFTGELPLVWLLQ